MICQQCLQGRAVSDCISPGRPREGPGMVQGSPGRGQGKGSGRLGKVQAGPRTAQGGHREGSWPREGMRETGKSRGGEEGRECVVRIPLPLWPQGEGRRLSKPAFSICLEHGRRGFRIFAHFWFEGGGRRLQSLRSFWPEGRGRGDAHVFGLQGEGEAFSTQTPLMSCGRGGV